MEHSVVAHLVEPGEEAVSEEGVFLELGDCVEPDRNPTGIIEQQGRKPFVQGEEEVLADPDDEGDHAEGAQKVQGGVPPLLLDHQIEGAEREGPGEGDDPAARHREQQHDPLEDPDDDVEQRHLRRAGD